MCSTSVSHQGPAQLQSHLTGHGESHHLQCPGPASSPCAALSEEQWGTLWAFSHYPHERRRHQPRALVTPCRNHTSRVPADSAAEKPKIWVPGAGKADSEVSLSSPTAQVINQRHYIHCKEMFISAGLSCWGYGLIMHLAEDRQGVTALQGQALCQGADRAHVAGAGARFATPCAQRWVFMTMRW